MRDVIRSGIRWGDIPDHVGLAYDAWAPIETAPGDELGKIPDERKQDWLAQLQEAVVSEDYQHFFDRWRASFAGDPSSRTVEVALAQRLLIGHGNPAPSEVGLHVHRTWGVPLIPGSALKGLLAHYLETHFAPSPRDRCHPLDPSSKPEIRERAKLQGPTWKGTKIAMGPGEVFRGLFGAPDAESDRNYRSSAPELVGAARGEVVFHDALMLPPAAPEAPEARPFAADVITPHHKTYADSRGADAWPNDYDSPIPIGFLSVRPKVHFLVALSGPSAWNELALALLRDALVEWGVGGKTSSGYGRIDPASWRPQRGSPRRDGRLDDVRRDLERWEGEGLAQRRILQLLVEKWSEPLRGLPDEAHKHLSAMISKVVKAKNVRDDRDAWLGTLRI
ncbi:type III-B CRISPR module RAMP protein Cmr6 [Myxococcota bacterium]|nr:type III-B CRISPR module RAMP protein Cmr6 [Myxococcota bacterium]